jgi:hypothetical protein
MTVAVTIPPSCSAEIRLPAAAGDVRESEAPLSDRNELQIVEDGDNTVKIEARAGTYSFVLPAG